MALNLENNDKPCYEAGRGNYIEKFNNVHVVFFLSLGFKARESFQQA